MQIRLCEIHTILRRNGYREERPLSYMAVIKIVSEAYSRGYEKAEADNRVHD